MKGQELKFKGKEDLDIYYYKWDVAEEVEIKGVILILHGMAEHALRYDDLANFLNEQGYIVYADDHRGHGKTGQEMGTMGHFGQGGWDLLVDDVYRLVEVIKSSHKDIPLILFGHSMGSILARTCVSEYGSEFSGLILSGTSNGISPVTRKLGLGLAKIVAFFTGGKKKSPFLNKVSFGAYNDKFGNDTPYEWLSRDKEVIQDYMDDELCGFICTSGFYKDMLDGINRNANKDNVKKVPKDLPIYIYSGDMDPVGNYKKDVEETYRLYKEIAGVEDVTLKFYKDGRHEMHNEINKAEVYEDLARWLRR